MTATRCSIWHDNLRHRYEAGCDVATLAYWHNVTFKKMRAFLVRAGTRFRTGEYCEKKQKGDAR